jgi:uncharacterized protein
MSRLSLAKIASLFSLFSSAFVASFAQAQIAISQVYGGASSGGAVYISDYVELFNRGSAPVSITGWSVQYASSTGTSWSVTNLSGSIPAGGYLLVKQGDGPTGIALPTPDVFGSTQMSGTNGKIALVSDQTALTGACPTGASIVDLVGYGSANCSEVAATAALSGSTAALRKANGCTDAGNNSTDFAVGTPNPRNSASPQSPCVSSTITLSINDVSVAEGNSGTAIASFTVLLSAPAPAGGVTFDIATADGTATTADNDYVAQSQITQTILAGATTYTFNVTINGDTTSEQNETFFVNVTNVVGATVSDGQGQGTIQNDDIGVTPINQIQGAGVGSPLLGQTITTRGIVTAAYPGFRGFYIQTPDANADTNAMTSEGIFVFTNSTTLDAQIAPGVDVQVTGVVSEFPAAPSTSGATQIAGTTASPLTLTFLSTGNPLPSPVTVSLPLASASALERYEGMRVTFPQTLTVSGNFTLGRFGEVVLSSGGRLINPSNAIDLNDDPPGGNTITGTSNVAAVQAAIAANALNQVTLDDATSTQNPDPTPFGVTAANADTLRAGSTIAGVVGIVNQISQGYRILSDPSNLPQFNRAARPLTPPDVGGQIKAAGFNVLNYFNGNGTNQEGAPGGFPTARGATTLAEFGRQRAKTVAAITQMRVHIIGLIEMENDGDTPQSALTDLVFGANEIIDTVIPAPWFWKSVDLPAGWGTQPGSTDQITTRLIYDSLKVETVGAPLVCNDTAFSNARAPLAQVFRSRATGGSVIVSINHFKSKGSCPTGGIDADQGDGQSCWAATRLAQAQALISCVSQWQTTTGESRVLLLGDFNAYEQENAIDVFRAAGMSTLINDSYSFVFDANSGALDHAIATSQLVPQITGADKWHINADEPISLDYNTEFKSVAQQTSLYAPDPFRSSDHDPALVGMNLAAKCAIDIDGNGLVESSKDALLVLRYLVGFRGLGLVDGAVGINPGRSGDEIEAYLATLNLDADGDGSAFATTDGLLILRELLGLVDAPLIEGARNVSSPNVRDAAQILSFIRNNLKFSCPTN